MLRKNPLKKQQVNSEENIGDTSSGVTVSHFAGTTTARRRMIGKILVVIMVLLIGSIGLIYFKNRDLYAIMDGTKITNREFREEKAAQQRQIDAMSGFEYEYLPITDDSIKKRLILMYALEQEARDRNVSVDDKEIRDSLALKYASLYPGTATENSSEIKADKVKQYYLEKYGWTNDYTNRREKVAILQKKLEPELLNQTNVTQVNLFLALESKLTEESGRVLMREKVSPILSQNRGTVLGLSEALAKENSFLSAQFLRNALDTSAYSDLTSQSRDAISKLTNVGQISEIVKTDENVLQMYRLEGKSETGDYGSWEALIDSYLEKTEFINASFDWRKFSL